MEACWAMKSFNQSIPLTGEDFDWEKETKNPKIAKKLVLSTKEKLDLLLKYLDIVRIPLPKSTKNGTLKKTNVTNGVAKQVREGRVTCSKWDPSVQYFFGRIRTLLQSIFKGSVFSVTKEHYYITAVHENL